MPFGVFVRIRKGDENGVLTGWVHSEGVMLQPAVWRGVAQHTSPFPLEGMEGR